MAENPYEPPSSTQVGISLVMRNLNHVGLVAVTIAGVGFLGYFVSLYIAFGTNVDVQRGFLGMVFVWFQYLRPISICASFVAFFVGILAKNFSIAFGGFTIGVIVLSFKMMV